jgi:1-phosphofructokinase family hexose kinase
MRSFPLLGRGINGWELGQPVLGHRNRAMFICVSPNPAIDKRLALASLVRGGVNRVKSAQSFPGGKSTHVAMVLRTLGAEPVWTGPVGGASGSELLAGLARLQLTHHPASTLHPTRTNLEIVEEDGSVTEILEPGQVPDPLEWETFEASCRQLFSRCSEKDSILFSGSLPQGAAPDLHARLIRIAKQSRCRVFLDTSGEPLRIALRERPYFVKPNREEAALLLNHKINSLADAAEALGQLLELGAQQAAVSLGAEGLLYRAGADAPVLFAAAIPQPGRSTVGCGDSTFAGFAFAIASELAPQETLRLAAACGAANCLAESPGAARWEDIQSLKNQVLVKSIAPKL